MDERRESLAAQLLQTPAGQPLPGGVQHQGLAVGGEQPEQVLAMFEEQFSGRAPRGGVVLARPGRGLAHCATLCAARVK